MCVDLKKITTESRNPNSLNIDQVSTIEILKIFNNEDKTVAYTVEKCLDQIVPLVDEIVASFLKNGRLIYIGAGTSGRIGLLDAAECHPTFSCPDEMIMCLMAGGDKAFVKAVEGAEDSLEMAIEQLKAINLNANDVLVGIAASGRTPYTVSAIKYANSLGCVTGCITTSASSPLASVSKYPIEAITGPEVLMGSTRLKAGTAQKLICNMISSAAMIKMGRSYSNLLTDMMVTNKKIVERSKNVLVEALGVTKDEAEALINKYKNTKAAIFAYVTGITDLKVINETLESCHGNINLAIKTIKNK